MLWIQVSNDAWCSQMQELNCIKAASCRNRSPLTNIYEHYLVRSGRGGKLEHLYPDGTALDTISRQDGQGSGKYHVRNTMEMHQHYSITCYPLIQYFEEPPGHQHVTIQLLWQFPILSSNSAGHKRITVLDIFSRQDDQECRKAAWSPEESFTLLEPKPAGSDLQEHGEIQGGIRLICMDGSVRNIMRQT